MHGTAMRSCRATRLTRSRRWMARRREDGEGSGDVSLRYMTMCRQPQGGNVGHKEGLEWMGY